MVSCLCTNTILWCGVVCEKWSIQTHDIQQEGFLQTSRHEECIQVDFGDGVAYLVTRMGSISFWIPLGDVLELHDVLFVHGLTNNLLSVLACQI